MQLIQKILRFPFFFVGFLLGLVVLLFFMASTSIGAWIEVGLRRVKLPLKTGWLAGGLGIAVYAVMGIVGPAYLGGLLLGWAGAILSVFLVLAVIVILGRW